MKIDLFDQRPLIYLITNGEMNAENYSEKLRHNLELIKNAVSCKIPLIQIREKRISAKLLYKFSLEAKRITRNTETRLLINDRSDIALATGADGVHLTSKSISPDVVRKNFPKDFLIGISVHSLEKAQEAKKQNADFACLSPIFPTPGKGKPLGLDALKETCEKLKPFPIIALGGIDETNFRDVLQISDGFAAIRFLNDVENLRKLNYENLFNHCGN